MQDLFMFIKFTIINKQHSDSKLGKILYDKVEDELKSRITKRLQTASNELDGLDLHVEIDMYNSNARLIAEGIPEDRIEIAKKAFNNIK